MPASGSAFGVSATGLVEIAATPTAPPDETVASIDQEPLLTTGLLTAEANETATGFTSSASVADVDALAVATPLPVPAAISADLLTSTCTADGTELTGDSTFAGLTIAGEPVTVDPEPNMDLSIPGVATIVANEQILSDDGQTLTVNALRIEVLDVTGTEITQEITIAQSVCTLAGDDGTTPSTTAPATTAPATTAPATTTPPDSGAPGEAPGAAPVAGQPTFTG